MKTKILALLCGLFAFVISTHAIPVTVDSITYDLSYVRTTFDADSTLLMSQPWWGHEALSYEFSAVTAGQLGYPYYGLFAPFFAFNVPGDGLFAWSYVLPSGQVGHAHSNEHTAGALFYYAVASPIATEPPTIPDAGATLGLAGGAIAALLLAARFR